MGMAEKRTHKNILAIIGSPRRGGNTDILVEQALQGAAEAGARTEKVALRDLDVRPCRGCDGCAKTGKCVQRDDLPGLLARMREADAWILATPVYYWGPTAQFKAFMDRWYGAGRIVGFKSKSAVLIVPLGSNDAHDARHAVGMIKDSLDHVGTRVLKTLVAADVFSKGAAEKRADLLSAARAAGRKAAAGK